MARCVSLLVVIAALVLALAGCSTYERPRRPAWRAQAEQACIAERRVHLSRYLQPRDRAIDGPGICGLTRPFLVGALSGDAVQLDAVATLDCPMVAALDQWIAETVQPIARARFGQPVVGLDTMGSYSCRGMNGQAGAKISEHAFGNAIDIGGFRLADGRRISVVHDWTRGDEQAQAFLRDVHAGACQAFTTVLGPGANIFHYNHIHVDLAMHGQTASGPRRICKPLPGPSAPGPRLDTLPDPQALEEEQDIADGHLPSQDPVQLGRPGLAVAAPPPYADTTRRGALAGLSTPRRGALREDGAFVPEGGQGDGDVTSTIARRR